SDQASRRTAAVGLETRDSCQGLTDVQEPDAYEKSNNGHWRNLTLNQRQWGVAHQIRMMS
ncbi:hypothetical protein, partial [Bradyrhizobium sp. LB11.1]|uniref:hypothetical protein n=1 Tax=Bradyrhizobium sp. LB11.1 TaxID=3156326 RepID=UPI00339ABF06